MTENLRILCAELADTLEDELTSPDLRVLELVDRARAALAEEELTAQNSPIAAGFDGAKGFQMPQDGLPLKVRLRRGSVLPSKPPDTNFREQLLWFMPKGQPARLLWCNADEEWFELSFTPIDKP